jgi:hypothetical protein
MRKEIVANHWEFGTVTYRWVRPQLAEIAGESKAELENPSPDCLIGDKEPPFRQQIFHIPVAQGEPEIKPDGMPDDLGWKVVASIGDALRLSTLPRMSPTRQLFP